MGGPKWIKKFERLQIIIGIKNINKIIYTTVKVCYLGVLKSENGEGQVKWKEYY